ncbi:MAG TPA: DNA-directed RNA polymerase subunit omega, partial [Clostridia bacterium]|nr:DNA-directed RNA polymerase subunit omega [Clostridia bacterium]
MNATLVTKALRKVPDPHVLVNLLSQRVRQLNSNDGGRNQPLVADIARLSAADIALCEIIEGKLNYEVAESVALVRPSAKNRKRP